MLLSFSSFVFARGARHVRMGRGGVSEFCRVMKANFAESLINISFPKNVGEGGGEWVGRS